MSCFKNLLPRSLRLRRSLPRQPLFLPPHRRVLSGAAMDSRTIPDRASGSVRGFGGLRLWPLPWSCTAVAGGGSPASMGRCGFGSAEPHPTLRFAPAQTSLARMSGAKCGDTILPTPSGRKARRCSPYGTVAGYGSQPTPSMAIVVGPSGPNRNQRATEGG